MHDVAAAAEVAAVADAVADVAGGLGRVSAGVAPPVPLLPTVAPPAAAAGGRTPASPAAGQTHVCRVKKLFSHVSLAGNHARGLDTLPRTSEDRGYG